MPDAAEGVSREDPFCPYLSRESVHLGEDLIRARRLEVGDGVEIRVPVVARPEGREKIAHAPHDARRRRCPNVVVVVAFRSPLLGRTPGAHVSFLRCPFPPLSARERSRPPRRVEALEKRPHLRLRRLVRRAVQRAHRARPRLPDPREPPQRLRLPELRLDVPGRHLERRVAVQQRRLRVERRRSRHRAIAVVAVRPRVVLEVPARVELPVAAAGGVPSSQVRRRSVCVVGGSSRRLVEESRVTHRRVDGAGVVLDGGGPSLLCEGVVAASPVRVAGVGVVRIESVAGVGARVGCVCRLRSGDDGSVRDDDGAVGVRVPRRSRVRNADLNVEDVRALALRQLRGGARGVRAVERRRVGDVCELSKVFQKSLGECPLVVGRVFVIARRPARQRRQQVVAETQDVVRTVPEPEVGGEERQGAQRERRGSGKRGVVVEHQVGHEWGSRELEHPRVQRRVRGRSRDGGSCHG